MFRPFVTCATGVAVDCFTFIIVLFRGSTPCLRNSFRVCSPGRRGGDSRAFTCAIYVSKCEYIPAFFADCTYSAPARSVCII